jgi:cation-dependent mannose-6-phosphate receptor
MRGLLTTLPLLLVAAFTTSALDDGKKAKPILPCTTHSQTTGSFFDLRDISLQPLKDGKKPGKNDRVESWHSRGYDYDANFTMNFCAPVLEEMYDIEGLGSRHWPNISGFYEKEGKKYSIG